MKSQTKKIPKTRKGLGKKFGTMIKWGMEHMNEIKLYQALDPVKNQLGLINMEIGKLDRLDPLYSQRTNEFGIRMALGARRREVLAQVLRKGLALSLGGVALGLLFAVGLSRFIEAQLFGVAPMDPVTFGVVSLLLVAVALLASYLPARRATRVDPLEALRYE